MKVLFVHGIGFHENNKALSTWPSAWASAIRQSCVNAGVYFEFDDPLGPDGKPGGADGDEGILFFEAIIRERQEPTGFEYLQTVSSLLKSYVTTKLGDLFNRERGFLDDDMRWKAHEVAAWAHDDKLRHALRKHVVNEIRDKNPDVVIAHSYGGLITYDACIFEEPDLLEGRYYVTLGTQIGNALLRREFGGRQIPVRAKHWFNLYNPGDPVFVAPLDHIRASNFTHLEVKHPNGHDGASYLGDPIVADKVWRAIGEGRQWLARSLSIRKLEARPSRAPRNRALLVGIDAYDSPDVPPLKGCVNDTFLLSAVLQESGIDPQSIRMLHNQRATKDNFLAQVRWLLDDAQPGDHRFLSFSGHGHRMASYDVQGNPDEMEEILVTRDYAFTQTTGLRDKDFQDLYAHLPREVHFLIFLDCCHSGGITRSGGPMVRSFVGPSDVEHECMRWNPEVQMWEQQGLAGAHGLNEKFLPPSYRPRPELVALWKQLDPQSGVSAKGSGTRSTKDLQEREYKLYYGEKGDSRRIGRATPLRDLPHDKFDALDARLRDLHGESGGPYLPLVFMACGEAEKACEYVHGSVSFGAFTFAMTQALRDAKSSGRPLTYGELLVAASKKLTILGYTQTPDILGNPKHLSAPTPFVADGAPRQTSRAKKTAKAPPRKKAGKRGPKKASPRSSRSRR